MRFHVFLPVKLLASLVRTSALTLLLANAAASPPNESPSAERREPLQPVPSRPPIRAGEHESVLRIGGFERRYTLHVPRCYDGTRRLPLVVMLHGGGGTGRAAARETGWAEKAERQGFLVAFPDALARHPARAANFVLNPQLWNDGSDRFYEGQERVDDVAFLAALLDDIAAHAAVDEHRVFLVGFSNGASMSFLAGARLAARFAAIAPVAGACWTEVPDLTPPVPMCYLTGTDDSLNLIEGGVPRMRGGSSDPVRAKPKPPVRDSILKWARANGCPSDPKVTISSNGIRIETYGPGRDGAVVRYVAVDGLGHTWAGGKSILPEAMVGPRTDKLSATDLIWEFFAQHARRAPSPPPP